ncbi:lysophospholipid acyltransferase family protein [Pontiellaceae bacterium B12219]|nr:lysophospholipid acyltransferase family protein [Pontiellaceae bacterium B12219]
MHDHRKKIRRALRRPLEAGGYILLKWMIPSLPRRAVMRLSKTLGNMAVCFPLRECKVGRKNLDAVFGDRKTEQEKRQILATSFSTFAQTMLDLFWFSKNSAQRISDYVSFEDTAFKEDFFKDRAVICITAHFGNWEIIGQAAALKGADMASIAATVKNKTVNRVLIELREKTGQTIIPQKGALKSLISRLRKNGKTAFVLDQNTHEADGGILVDFLGLPMPVSPAPAALAYRTGTEIMFGFCLPLPDGRYTIQISNSITPPPFDKEADMDAIVLDLTRQIQDIISEQIMKTPEFWLWSYKHWRRKTNTTYPAHYPEY